MSQSDLETLDIQACEATVIRGINFALENNPTINIEWVEWAKAYLAGNRDRQYILNIAASSPTEAGDGAIGRYVSEIAEKVSNAANWLSKCIENEIISSYKTGEADDIYFADKANLSRTKCIREINTLRIYLDKQDII